MLEEKTQHFPRCVRSPRIRVGARGTTPRPRMGAAVDAPMLQDFAAADVNMRRPGVVMAFGYPPVMNGFLRVGRTNDLYKNLTAVDWMYGGVAVTVKNNCRDRRAVLVSHPATGSDDAWQQMRSACQ